jgi:hypothetical protein
MDGVDDTMSFVKSWSDGLQTASIMLLRLVRTTRGA